MTRSLGAPRLPDRAQVGPIVTSTWFLGVLVSLLSWNVLFLAPQFSLDPSWQIGLQMATRSGMNFGEQVVFTYGPLGFLRFPVELGGALATLAFIYRSLLHVALCLSLIWALRRLVHPAIAALVALFAVDFIDPDPAALQVAAIWCLVALAPGSPLLARRLVAFPGAILAAIETLSRLSYGPAVLVICLATLAAMEDRRRLLTTFAASYAIAIAALWLATGQGLANVDDFARQTLQVSSGYSQAAALEAGADWQLPGALAVAALLLIAAATGLRDAGPRRVAGIAVVGVVLWLTYKEGFVRHDIYHGFIYFSTAFVLCLSIPWRLAQRALAAAAIAAGCLLVLYTSPKVRLAPEEVPTAVDPVHNTRLFGTEVRTLLSPGRREELTEAGRALMVATYAIDPRTLELLRGHAVHVDPWEVGAAWAYGLRWRPLPVFQDYVAYTSELDRLNSEALASPDGPDRILRENSGPIDPDYPLPSIDRRYPPYDPPGASIAMLCNFAPLRTTDRWQVLGRVPDRCGAPRRIDSVEGRFGEEVAVPPAPGTGQVVFARLRGAGLGRFESLRSLLYRARERHVFFDGDESGRYRLVPGTAGDGLLMRIPRGIDFPPPFSLAPNPRTITVQNDADSSGSLAVDFYAMRVRRTAEQSARSGAEATPTADSG